MSIPAQKIRFTITLPKALVEGLREEIVTPGTTISDVIRAHIEGTAHGNDDQLGAVALKVSSLMVQVGTMREEVKGMAETLTGLLTVVERLVEQLGEEEPTGVTKTAPVDMLAVYDQLSAERAPVEETPQAPVVKPHMLGKLWRRS